MLLKISEVADLLRTTPGAARGVLKRLNVTPIDLGRGRGLGLRWKSDDILEALEKTKPVPNTRAKPRPLDPILSRSRADLIDELVSPGRLR